jgi:hypothetical protein
VDSSPAVARAVVQGSLYRSWLLNMRRRSAPERLAHLFCEQFAGLRAIGLDQLGVPIPLHIVQSDLADATGTSVIHLNRTLQHLRNWNLIGRNHSALEILDWDGLKELAEFEPSYLHSRRAKQPDGSFDTAESRAERHIEGLASKFFARPWHPPQRRPLPSKRRSSEVEQAGPTCFASRAADIALLPLKSFQAPTDHRGRPRVLFGSPLHPDGESERGLPSQNHAGSISSVLRFRNSRASAHDANCIGDGAQTL